METLRYVLVILHLIGMAMIVGGYFASIKSPRVQPGMLHASYLQLVTGLLLVGLAEMRVADSAAEVNHVKIAVKVILAILVTVFAFLGNRKQKRAGTHEGPQPSALMAHLTLACAVLAVIVAVVVPGMSGV